MTCIFTRAKKKKNTNGIIIWRYSCNIDSKSYTCCLFICLWSIKGTYLEGLQELWALQAFHYSGTKGDSFKHCIIDCRRSLTSGRQRSETREKIFANYVLYNWTNPHVSLFCRVRWALQRRSQWWAPRAGAFVMCNGVEDVVHSTK